MHIGFELRNEIKNGMNEYIRNHTGKDIDHLLFDLEKLTGIPVTQGTLNNWIAHSRDKANPDADYSGNKRWGFPADLIPAFCYLTKHYEPLFLLTDACHFKAMKGRAVVQARATEIEEQIEELKGELKQVKGLLKKQ